MKPRMTFHGKGHGADQRHNCRTIRSHLYVREKQGVSTCISRTVLTEFGLWAVRDKPQDKGCRVYSWLRNDTCHTASRAVLF